jgi:PAS domain S-box-containing protein
MESPGGGETLDSVLKAMSDPACGLDEAGRITDWNDAARTAFGYSNAEAMGEPVDTLLGLNANDRDRVESLLAEPELGNGSEERGSAQITLTKADGTTTDVTLRPVGRRSGSLLCLFERRAKPRFEASDTTEGDLAIYRRAVEESADLLAATDRDERILFANERYREFHGIDGPVAGEPLADVLSMNVYEEVQPRIDRALSGETLQFETQRRDATGTTHDLNVRYYPIENGEGEIEAAVATLRDVTELKSRATALKDAWETYSELVEGIPDPIVLFDGDGEILEVNRAACQLLGRSERSLLETPLEEHLYEDRTAWIDAQVEGATEAVVFEAEFVTDTGETVPVEIAATRIDYFGTEATLTVARDLTDRKAYERQLEEANARLEEFAAVLTQDLRNPLTVAQGWTDIAREADNEEALDQIADSLDRIEQVIDYTFTLAREGDNIGQYSTVDLSTVVDRSWHAVGNSADTLKNRIEQNVRGDDGRLGYLFETVFRGSVERTDGPVTVAVDELDMGDGFYVADDGPGHPTDRRSGWSAHVGTPEGCDFDVKVLRRIADAHGWRLRVRESAGGGARFEFHGVETAAETD